MLNSNSYLYKYDFGDVIGSTVKLLAAGDVAFIKNDQQFFKRLSSKELAPQLKELVEGSDSFLFNLESPIVDKKSPSSKSGPNLAVSPNVMPFLKKNGFTLAGLANNHMMDQGLEGLQATLQICKQNGINTLGAGRNLFEAQQPFYLEKNNIVAGFLAVGEEEFGFAKTDRPGAAPMYPLKTGELIRQIRQKCDLLILFAHGGKEYYPLPSPRIKEWYHYFVECGACAVIGHHPHIIQPVEIYKNVPIIYSLGNYFFPVNKAPFKCWHKGLLAELTLSKKGVSSIVLYFMNSENDDLHIISGQQLLNYKQQFDYKQQIVLDDDLVQKFWKCFCSKMRQPYFNSLKFSAGSLKSSWSASFKSAVKCRDISYLSYLINDLLHLLERNKTCQSHMNSLKNLLVCPSHYEIISTLINAQMSGEIESIHSDFEKVMKEA